MSGKAASRRKNGKERAEAPSGPRKDLLATEVLDRAAQLFAQRGFNGTSLQEVADAVGLSRTALYYYFPSKDALLDALLEDVTIRASRILGDIEARSGIGPLDRIREAMRRLVLWVADGQNRFKMIDRSEDELPPQIAKRHLEAKRHVLEAMTRLIAGAIDAGEARPVDPRLAAFAAIGMCNWTAWWFNPGGTLTADQIADTLADLFVASIRRKGAAAGDIGTLTAEIRETLDLIDRAARRKPG
ncbi:MAG: TetR family transcriptional regulator [Rhodospirillaceae bacterium]|nr:TetR family transcriptional regulator [Rhodospirillaceae bacterium]